MGHFERAAETARHAVADNPLMEEAHCALMRVYAEMGQPSAVLRQFQELERVLMEELGEEPSPTTRLLMESLRQSAQARAASLTNGIGNGKSIESSLTIAQETQASAHPFPSAAILPRVRPAPLHRLRPLALAGSILLLLLLVWPVTKQRLHFTDSQKPHPDNASTAIPVPKVLWVARNRLELDEADGGDPQAMTTDAAGNIYVAGFVHTLHTDVDFLTLKIDPNGKILWKRRYDGPSHDVDRARAIAVDDNGYVYVVGDSDNGKGNKLTHLCGLDYAIVKYDPDGKPSSTWPDDGSGVGVRRYNGPDDGEERPVAIAVDRQGNVVVTGYSYAKSKFGKKPTAVMEWATVSYGADGKKRWAQHEKADGDTPTEACALALDLQGNVYVTGSIGIGNGDVMTIKYSSTGERLWERRYGGPGNGHDYGRAIALDAAGNVYVGGTSYSGDPLDSNNMDDFLILKFDSLGNPLWHRTWDAGRRYYERFGGMAVDPEGNVYLSGQTDGARAGGGSWDLAWCKCSPEGKIEWGQSYNGPGNGGDRIEKVCVDSRGNSLFTGPIYTGSREHGGTEYDFITLKCAPDGRVLWRDRYNAFDSDDQAVAVCVDRQDNAIVAGSSDNGKKMGAIVVLKYAP